MGRSSETSMISFSWYSSLSSGIGIGTFWGVLHKALSKAFLFFLPAETSDISLKSEYFLSSQFTSALLVSQNNEISSLTGRTLSSGSSPWSLPRTFSNCICMEVLALSSMPSLPPPITVLTPEILFLLLLIPLSDQLFLLPLSISGWTFFILYFVISSSKIFSFLVSKLSSLVNLRFPPIPLLELELFSMLAASASISLAIAGLNNFSSSFLILLKNGGEYTNL